MAERALADPTRIACLFATSGHSGVDRAVKNLIPALARRGYRIDLLKVRGHGPDLGEAPPGVRVIDLGVHHTYAALPAVVGYLRRTRPAVLLSDKDRVNRTALLARALARAPTRLALRSGTTLSRDLASRRLVDRTLQRLSVGWLYPFAETVITNSRNAADDMAAYTGLPRERIQVVPNPVVPAELLQASLPRPDHRWLLPGAPPVILGVGELCTRKDFATLVRAFALLRRMRPCRLLILGRGRQREALLGLAASLGVGDDVELPGYLPSPFAYMAHAAVLAFTSRWEGNPFVLPEALAVGTPVVATDCPSGPREVLAEGRYGRLVPIGDATALAAALAATLDDPLPPERLREAAQPFEIETSATAYLAAMGLPERCTR